MCDIDGIKNRLNYFKGKASEDDKNLLNADGEKERMVTHNARYNNSVAKTQIISIIGRTLC